MTGDSITSLCLGYDRYQRHQIRYFFNLKVLGPVVQNIVSLTSSLRVISLTVFSGFNI